MKKESFKERVARLQEVGKVISGLDPEIRLEAFQLLKSYIESPKSPPTPADHSRKVPISPSSKSREEFFSAFDHDRPADNVKLITAFLYNQYGVEPFSAHEIDRVAMEVGLTVPARIDRTITQAKTEGKSVYRKTGRGSFKPTVHGEKYLKKTYQVSKGRMSKPKEDTAE